MHGVIGPRPDFEWFPDWSQDVCAIIASGPSVTAENVEKLKGRCKVIVVNNGCKIAPWADVLYAADDKWWECYSDWKNFAGLKITQHAAAAQQHRLRLVYLADPAGQDEKSRFTLDRKGYIARGGNSAFQANGLALQFGSRRLIWIGFDFNGVHWHGKHNVGTSNKPTGLRNPRDYRLGVWAKTLDDNAPILARMGAEVLNCSPMSSLNAYPIVTVDEALERWT